MSTRFYSGPISIGMGRRWDDKLEPEAGPSLPPRRGRPAFGRTTAPLLPPAAPSADPRSPRIDPIAPPR